MNPGVHATSHDQLSRAATPPESLKSTAATLPRKLLHMGAATAAPVTGPKGVACVTDVGVQRRLRSLAMDAAAHVVMAMGSLRTGGSCWCKRWNEEGGEERRGAPG